MSELWLPVALAATFGSVAAVGVSVTLSMAERRRTLKLLEAQVGPVNTNLRQREMSRPLIDRALLPVVKAVTDVARRLTPRGARARIEKKLALAGAPVGWDVEKVATFKVVGVIGGMLLGIMVTRSADAAANVMFLFTLLLMGIGFFAPDGILASKADKRQSEIRRALPDTMDLLTISVEAGLGFDAALVQVVNNVPGALSLEISRMLHEMRLGESRIDAFRHLSERTNVEELDSFILAMIQAETFGVSIAKVLRAQAKEMRTKRRQRAEEQAMKVPVKILFPLVFCILPTLFVVILGPGAIRIAENLFGLNL